jgi:hypothetical protein
MIETNREQGKRHHTRDRFDVSPRLRKRNFGPMPKERFWHSQKRRLRVGWTAGVWP